MSAYFPRPESVRRPRSQSSASEVCRSRSGMWSRLWGISAGVTPEPMVVTEFFELLKAEPPSYRAELGTVTAGDSSQFTVFEKFAPSHWILCKCAHSEVGPPPGKGCHWDEHQLEHRESHRRIQLPNWEWADVDGETVVWAENGCFHRATLGDEGLTDVRINSKPAPRPTDSPASGTRAERTAFHFNCSKVLYMKKTMCHSTGRCSSS
jgi:hypothetical protein